MGFVLAKLHDSHLKLNFKYARFDGLIPIDNLLTTIITCTCCTEKFDLLQKIGISLYLFKFTAEVR